MQRAINKTVERILAITGGNVHSVWLYGSVVLDDFRLGWSDIDILVLTDGPIAEEAAQELAMLRQTLLSEEPDNPYYRSFEGIIASAEEFREKDFRRVVYWGTSGQRVRDSYEMDVFSQYELAKYGRSVYGSDDRSIFTAPSRESLIKAVRFHYDTIRQYAIQTNDSLYSCGWLLDIARCIYTVRTGEVIAKTQAGEWALEEHIFPEEDALRRTLEIRRNPEKCKDRADVKLWLKGLGPTVQKYADVLEDNLSEYSK